MFALAVTIHQALAFSDSFTNNYGMSEADWSWTPRNGDSVRNRFITLTQYNGVANITGNGASYCFRNALYLKSNYRIEDTDNGTISLRFRKQHPAIAGEVARFFFADISITPLGMNVFPSYPGNVSEPDLYYSGACGVQFIAQGGFFSWHDPQYQYTTIGGFNPVPNNINDSWHTLIVNVTRLNNESYFVMSYDGNIANWDTTSPVYEYPQCGDHLPPVTFAFFGCQTQFDNDYGEYDIDDFSITSNTSLNPQPIPVGCTTPTFSYPIILYDNFNYSCAIQSNGWQAIPSQAVAPVAGEFCNASAGTAFIMKHLLPVYIEPNIVTETFDLTVPTGASAEASFDYQQNEDAVEREPVHLIFSDNGTDTSIDAFKAGGGTYNVCKNCFTANVKQSFTLRHYNLNTGGASFYNTSSASIQPILPQTYTLVTPNISLFNLPQFQPLNENFTSFTDFVRFAWFGGTVCVDNIQAQIGEAVAPEPGSPQCNKPACTDTCIWRDDFSYNGCKFSDERWSMSYGRLNETPLAGSMCYNASLTAQAYSRAEIGAPTYYDTTVDEFDMVIQDTNAYVEHWVDYLDSTTVTRVRPFKLAWFTSGGHTQLNYYTTINGVPSVESLCTDCWEVGVRHHYKITMHNFHPELRNLVFSNSTSSNIPILPLTFSVVIDGNTTGGYYNLPQFEELTEGHTLYVNRMSWTWDGGRMCLDNTYVHGEIGILGIPSTTEGAVNTGDLRQCWQKQIVGGVERTSFDWSCCYADEAADHSLWCPSRVTGLFFLANVTSFILGNLVYFIVLAMLFVLVTPYLVPRRG